MANEYRTSQYWGAGDEGMWYKDNIEKQAKLDPRFRDSLVRFVRYAVRYTLLNDPSIKDRPISSPGE